MAKLRILCLHGFTSNGAVHAHQLRRLTSQLPDYDFLFPEGPHRVDIAEQMDMSKPANQAWSDIVMSASDSGHRAWWFARDGEWKSKTGGGFIGLEESLEYLGAYVEERGPVHAVWGFSQGACLAGMLCALLQSKHAGHPLRKHLEATGTGIATPLASVIFSGFRARYSQYDGLYEPGIDVPMLHVLGEQDPLVRSERSEALLRVCKRSERIVHAGGHDIPKGAEDVAKIIEFTRRHLRSGGESAGQGFVQALI
ncbi:uncharacterized protein CC84DRAFT_1164068 [Paraphaeosphaeria sporulosa]|uniref:Serine hydrolase domain-containing protein n=1 Tax=Paraphaeosphaeria sporulosa TaxID=1460663 RepID=A0A177CFR3_9PLEO|nr:uncharacterized protein CC84DRAFT_1164068 [Paraphaeosphaeria sporulosa]OAG05570.1 hypothetical protein CC84DRAFT_1164068 [Paraphaeosphaeria sporulosa]